MTTYARIKEEGKIEGKIEGKLESNKVTAKRSWLRGFSVEDISDLTNLPIEEVKQMIHEFEQEFKQNSNSDMSQNPDSN